MSTSLYTFREFVEEQLQDYLESKENPDEWYVLGGRMATEYSVWADAEMSPDYEEYQEELPPEERDAQPNVEGTVQIGTAGWHADAFDFEDESNGFVSEVQWGDKIERNLMNMLLVHEDVLSEEALEHVNGEAGGEEVPADD